MVNFRNAVGDFLAEIRIGGFKDRLHTEPDCGNDIVIEAVPDE